MGRWHDQFTAIACRDDGFTEVKRKGRRRLTPAPSSVLNSSEEQHEVPQIPLLVDKVVACRLELTCRKLGNMYAYFTVLPIAFMQTSPEGDPVLFHDQ